MWVFTPKGFFSIVEDKNNPDRFNVSAHTREHLYNLFPRVEIYANPDGDCAWKVNVPRTEMTSIMATALHNIDYFNAYAAFPHNLKYVSLCHDIFCETLNLFQFRQTEELSDEELRRVESYFYKVVDGMLPREISINIKKSLWECFHPQIDRLLNVVKTEKYHNELIGLQRKSQPELYDLIVDTFSK